MFGMLANFTLNCREDLLGQRMGDLFGRALWRQNRFGDVHLIMSAAARRTESDENLATGFGGQGRWSRRHGNRDTKIVRLDTAFIRFGILIDQKGGFSVVSQYAQQFSQGPVARDDFLPGYFTTGDQ